MVLSKKNTYVSIDMSNDRAKCVVGGYSDGMLTVNKMFIVDFGEKLYDNGKVIDKNKLEVAIKNAFSLNNVKTKDVITLIETNAALVREIFVPKVDGEDLIDVINMEIANSFPINPDEYIIECRILGEVQEALQPKYKLLVAAAPKIMIEELAEFFRSIGLRIKIIDLNSNAINKIHSEILKKHSDNPDYTLAERAQNTIAYLGIDGECVEVSIFNGEQYEFNRSIKIEQNTNELKQNSDEALAAIATHIEVAFKYYTSRKVGNAIDEVFLYGDVERIKGLENFVTDKLDMPVNTITRLNGVIDKNDVQTEKMTEYINAIGALIRL